MSETTQTLVIAKPDAVERGLIGAIIGRLEAKGLRIVAADLRRISRSTAAEHYAEHADKPFYESLLDFVTRSPAMVMIVEAPCDAGADAYETVRTLIGATNPAAAAPGTIRGDFGLLPTENLVHGSDGNDSAAREIALFFPGGGSFS